MSGVRRVCTFVMCVIVLSAVVVIGYPVGGRCQGSLGSGPMVINVKTDPMAPRTGDTIRLLFDLAGDAIRAEVAWSINGQQVQTSQYDLQNTSIQFDQPIKLGDVIVASITAYDAGGNSSRPYERRIVCQKAAPVVKITNEAIRAGMYTAKVAATDPDGGRVTLTLEEGPEGLKMDESGNIEWRLEKDKSGRFPLKVVAEDERGNKSYFMYEVGIKWSK
jgi:hypothetical protein